MGKQINPSKFVDQSGIEKLVSWIKDNFVTIEQHEQDLANLRAELLAIGTVKNIAPFTATISNSSNEGQIVMEKDNVRSCFKQSVILNGKKELIGEIPYDRYIGDTDNPTLGLTGYDNSAVLTLMRSIHDIIDDNKHQVDDEPRNVPDQDTTKPSQETSTTCSDTSRASSDDTAWAEINKSIASQWNEMIGGKNGISEN